MGYIKQFDLVEETTSTTGTGALTLTGALAGRRTFAAHVAVDDEFLYRLEAEDGSYHEIGRGRRLSDGTIQRLGDVRAWNGASDSTSPLNLPAGVKRIAIVQPAIEAPVSMLGTQPPRVETGNFASFGLAWGNSATVYRGEGGVAIGASSYSANGGAAVGVNASASGVDSWSGPRGTVYTAGRSGMAGPRATANDGWCLVLAGGSGRASDTRTAQGVIAVRGVTASSAAGASMQFYTTDSLAVYEITLAARRLSDNAIYSARLTCVAKGSEYGTPTIHDTTVASIFVTGGVSLANPTMTAGANGLITLGVPGENAQDWVWGVTAHITRAGV